MNPVFTTSDPYSLVIDVLTPPDVREEHPPNVPVGNPTRSGSRIDNIYLHGKAEDLCGFDLPDHVDGHFNMVIGEHPCYVQPTANSDKVEALVIVWQGRWRKPAGLASHFRINALIVTLDDERSLAYARECARTHQHNL